MRTVHGRLIAWCKEAGEDPGRWQPTAVRLDGGTVVVVLNHDAPPARIAAFRALVAELLGAPVAVEADPGPDPARRLVMLWRAHQGHFVELFADGAVRVDDPGVITVEFPNAMAQSLFEEWGGERRSRELWPEMPPLRLLVGTPAPPAPDPVVPLEDPGPDVVSARAGKGRPGGDAIPLRALPESGSAVVEGRIFHVDARRGRDGLWHLTISLYDGTGAARLKVDQRRGQAEFTADRFQVGDYVRARGTLEPDKYSGETVLRVRDMGLSDAPPPLVDGHDRPRMEFHLHSKMSAMDGLIELRDAFAMAKSLGHPALAVVDHGVVQAYPEAAKLAKATGVDAIYGVEVYLVDDARAALAGAEGRSPFVETPWVVVDVETTGLTPKAHEVIEIGAVKVVRGQIVDRFQRLIRPSRPVSRASLEITGIGQAELEQGVSGQEAFRDFFAFAEGALLAAHNAPFDMGFLARAYAERHGGPWPFPVLDSLALAQIALPGLKSYGLDPLARHLSVPLAQHHRALADAEATAGVILAILERLGAKGQDEGWLRTPQPVEHTIGRPTPAVILVRDQDGIEPLYRLVSEAHLRYFHRVPRVPRRLIAEHRGHWLIGSPFRGGEVQDALFRGVQPDDLRRVAAFYDYWEVAPVDVGDPLLREEHYGDPAVVEAEIRTLVELAHEMDKLCLAVSDAHYLRPEDGTLRDILAETGKGELHDRGAALYYRTTSEMLQAFLPLGAAQAEAVVVEAPAALRERIAGGIRPIPDGLYAPSMPEAEDVVSNQPRERAKALYGDPLPAIVAERLHKEIEAIVRNGFAVSYYIAHLLVKKSLADGYLVGSRGSVGSSLVATLLDITEVNPLPPHYRCPGCRYTEFVEDEAIGSGFDLPERNCPACGAALARDGQDIAFETFLGFEGDKVPDIDLNFSGDYQGEIHRYTEELFGKGHVFRAGTIATVADKTAFGLVKAWERETGRTLAPAEIDYLALALTGVKRTTGQHPGGVMVVPRDQDIHRFTPVQRPADNKATDVVTTHFDYHAIEGRLVKLDLLGHDDPTAIRLLEELTGIGPHAVPFQDAATLSIFSGVEALGVTAEQIGSPVGTLGIPEFGTSFVRGMLTETRPRSFADLIRISGISHGTEVWTNNAQEIIRRGQASLSEVISTRDDIMLYLIQRGLEPRDAFGISESVRRGKGLKPEMERALRDHGVPEWYIESCQKITYLFPKAHAAAYVMMGWRIAWFKVHHPLAYYATYFSVRAGDFPDDVAMTDQKTVSQAIRAIEEKGNEATPKERGLITVLEILREMMARGFSFAPVDLAASDATRFRIDDGRLRIPFAALSGVGETAARNIVRAREEAPFLSIADLRERARLTKPVIELLRSHGALNDLGESSQLAFF